MARKPSPKTPGQAQKPRKGSAPAETPESVLTATEATPEVSLVLDPLAVVATPPAAPLKPSGWAKIKAAGRKAVMLTLTPDEYDRFKVAAQADRRPLSSWIVNAALQQLKFSVPE